MKARVRVSALLVALLAPGCRACHGDRPYVPYAIGSSDPVAHPAPDAAAPSAADAGAGDIFASEPSLEAPAGLARWAVQDTVLDAPDGFLFRRAIFGDFDGDGQRDAFAIVGPAVAGDPGELVFYRGAPGASAPAAAWALLAEDRDGGLATPPEVAQDPSCTAVDRLVRVGKATVLVELGRSCALATPNSPSRYVALVDGGPQARARFALAIIDPPGAAALSVDAAIGDRDGDGRDDVALRVSIEGGGAPFEPGPRVSMTLVWLDRRAGLSRDTGATESSLASVASWVTTRAMRTRDAADVPGYVAQLRALWRAVCADGGAPRILPVTGTSRIACGSSHALEEAGLAEARAYASLGDGLRSALAFDRAGRPPATHTASRAVEALKWLATLAPAASARLMRTAAAVPIQPVVRTPSWGALAFESSGKLLIRTRAGVVRMDPDVGDEASAGVADWKDGVTSPDGAIHWLNVYDPCEGPALRATFDLSGGAGDRDLLLPVRPPLAARCLGPRKSPARSTPVSWGRGGLEAIVEDEPILIAADLSRAWPLKTFLGQPVTPGAPRSPNGKSYVFPTELGLFVQGEGASRLLRSSDLEKTYAQQHDCVVSDDLTHVACVHGVQAWVGTWDKP